MKIRDIFYQVLFLMIIICLSSFTNLFAQIKVDSLIKVTNIENAYPFWSLEGNKIVFQSKYEWSLGNLQYGCKWFEYHQINS